ncbi:hypothetical protein [Spelaeicoccus albus]|uniref:Uncharacterized protein n=1 Tax=Spelaeicoccus albus TaxID=1280376 RepID=A0A7Z0D4G4_9MICO|nr:hypothetical protein [Spelaeicoccus albus]NYI68712.1 hypothetical protein [Spelaeicoccus albus]
MTGEKETSISGIEPDEVIDELDLDEEEASQIYSELDPQFPSTEVNDEYGES